MSVTLHIFTAENPPDAQKLAYNFAAFSIAIRILARRGALQVPPGNVGLAMRTRGGTFSGPVSAPAISIRAQDGTLTVPVTADQLAGGGTLGLVRRAAGVDEATIDGTLVEQLDNLGGVLNALLAALQDAGSMGPY